MTHAVLRGRTSLAVALGTLVPCALFAAPDYPIRAERQVDVRVRVTPGGPQIQVDGASVAPRFFWNFDNPKRRPVDGVWRRHRISFTPRVDCGLCQFALNPQEAAGRFEFRGVDTNALYRAERGKTLAFDFEVRADGDVTYFRPALFQLEPRYSAYQYHRRMMSVPADDPTDSNFVSQCAKARRAGVRFFSFFTPNLWPDEPEGEIAFAAFDKTCDALIAAVPDALIVPRVPLNPPNDWLDAHPATKMVFEAGLSRPAPSVNAPEYRAAVVRYARRVARHFMDRYPRHFAGLHVTGQSCQEWYYYGSTWAGLHGYDGATRAAYGAWLKEQGLPPADVPTPTERDRQDAVRGLIDPAARPNVLLFNRFLSESLVDFFGMVNRAVREETGGKKLTLAFYGYTYELVGNRYGMPATGNCAVQRVIDRWAKDIDILCAPQCYTDRAAIGTSPVIGPAETVNRNAMLWLNEDDLRTHLIESFTSGEGVHQAPIRTPAETRAAMRRTMLQEIVRGHAGWWMDHGGGWYDSWEEIWQPIADLDALERATLKRARPYAPEVALFVDEDSMLCFAPESKHFAHPLIHASRKQFPRAGVAYGQYTLQDALAKPLSSGARLRFHLSTYRLTPEKERRLLAARAREPKAARVWCHLPGILGERGVSTDGTARLTGFAARLVTSGPCEAAATDLGRSLGLPEKLGTREAVGRLVPGLKDGDEVWAKWADGTPAIVVRPTAAGGLDVLSGPAELPAGLIRALAVRAGLRPRLAADEVGRAAVWYSDDLEVIQSHTDGFRDFRKGEVRTVAAAPSACLTARSSESTRRIEPKGKVGLRQKR